VILYEYPFNERIRTYLRLEQLFRRLGELIARSHPLDHHFALTTIFEIMDVAARADLKADVLKDIEKQKHVLDGYRGKAESIYLLLKLLRDSGVPQKVATERGQIQQNLPQGRTFQLLRLRIDPALGLVPEISGNRLMVSVRLMRQLPDGPLQANAEDAMFELTLCA